MNTRLSQLVLRGGIITSLILGVSLILGGYRASAAGMHGHGPGGMPTMREFGGHHVMFGPQHAGFPWLGLLVFFIIGIAVAVLLVKWLKNKSKTPSMEHFIQTTLASPYKSMNSQNEHILDQWEKELNKKENV
ncbi:hypothetical protein [Ureibacillus aquaedulcis]|uniref:Uncharacterized protein n=1 Tax=Ureibacillus aquaedulcis TaxID=3058421 RepID=A0ABT8GSF9_9BACL|nr:hypothetical protein [Ureibacillus sp. BA0131]MDN4494335.1 hypothetical protein [Ureibacillus sp. BA0131]